MALTAIRDINNEIKNLLRSNIPDLTDENSVVFDSPGDLENSTTPKVSLFLYLITENSFLRNTDQIPVGTNKMRFPPVSVDLHYLITPYAKDKDTELLILENVIQIINDYPVLNSSTSANTPSDPAIRITPRDLSIDDLNKLWSIFPNKTYRISFAYVVTPVIIQSSKTRDVTRVSKVETKFHLKE